MRKIIAAFLLGIVPTWAEDSATVPKTPQGKWNVELSRPTAPSTTDAERQAQEPEKVDFTVQNSHSKKMNVTEAPEIQGLPAVEGRINVTIQKVANPDLPDPPPDLPALAMDDPAVLARLQALRETRKATQIVFISASVFDGKRTLLKIYPNGGGQDEVTAWSNVNFMQFTGQSGYHINLPDGTNQEVSMLLGIGPISSDSAKALAARRGVEYEAPNIPSLPDLATGGPAFVVVAGTEGSPAMNILEQLHDLYLTSASELEADYQARLQALAERKAYLLAHPQKPKDVTIRVWKRTLTENQSNEEGANK
jgi:hypothetical protein